MFVRRKGYDIEEIQRMPGTSGQIKQMTHNPSSAPFKVTHKCNVT